jgi:pyridoxine 5-phosphate synthase
MILGVNVDHIATVRQARGNLEPDPVMAAHRAIKGGADGITVHLREDRRHIQDRDLRILRRKVLIELNLEMAATKEMIGIALRTRPDLVTLVPEKRAELTTEGGLNLKKNINKIRKAVDTIQKKGIPVSLFINPVPEDVILSSRIGAQMIEIHTGIYSNARGKRQTAELSKVKRAVKRALKIGLEVNAGHGLDYTNVGNIASIKGIRGLYIGHSIVSHSLFVGMEKAVREMKKIINSVTRNT